jgi:hypothetical protein
MKNFKINPLIIELRPSRMIKGEIGLFAVRNLKKGTIIALATRMGETFVSWTAYNQSDKKTQIKIQQFCLQTNEGFYIPDDLNYLSVPWYMNHSCSYNVGFDKDGNYITARDIVNGEELVIDYGLAISNPVYKLTCKCKSKNCRKEITGNDWHNDKFITKNKDYVLRELIILNKMNKKSKQVVTYPIEKRML